MYVRMLFSYFQIISYQLYSFQLGRNQREGYARGYPYNGYLLYFFQTVGGFFYVPQNC